VYRMSKVYIIFLLSAFLAWTRLLFSFWDYDWFRKRFCGLSNKKVVKFCVKSLSPKPKNFSLCVNQ